MRRRLGVAIGLSALLIGTLGTAGTVSTATAAPMPSPGILKAMQTEFGLSEQQALNRLAAEAEAAETEPAAEQAAGASYAGSWFDAESGKLTVAVTDDAAADAVAALGAEAELVAYSAEELDSAKSEIDDWSDNAPAGIASWTVDPQANRVVVQVVDGQQNTPEVREFIADAQELGPVTVKADATEQPSTLAAGTVGGDPWYTGNVRCSIGFSVHGGFVTAGHCGGVGQAVRGWDGSHIGHIQGSSFPGDDLAWVNVGSGWWTVPVVIGWGAIPDQLVRGSAEAPIGSSVCRSGSTTGWRCGTILSKNDTVNYEQGAVHQMTGTSACAQGGDSGGSFITGDQAQGVTSGGYGNCASGGRTWYQPVNEILARYGLTLHTY